MAEPFSIAASICGIVSLADLVVTKGYKYIKTVKDCQEEVKNLFVEVNVFCGVLDRLAKMLDEEDDEGENGHAQAHLSSVKTSIPEYVIVCQKTLNQILHVLDRFERKAASATPGTGRRRKVLLSCLPMKDLKWPLSKDETLTLIESLERHKSTCILALSASDHATLERLLSVSMDTKNVVTKLHEGQTNLLKFVESEESSKLWEWLSPVNSNAKHKRFYEDYQPGTCLWVFDLPEYKDWAMKPNEGLFIYGIPGAGKTTLASCIIENLRVQKPLGFAFFYCRHDDQNTHSAVNIWGSLIAQLASQSTEAYAKALALYKTYNAEGQLPGTVSEQDLVQTLVEISQHYCDVTLVIDGMDEFGTPSSRGNFLKQISQVCRGNHKTQQVRLLVLARAEVDILEGFCQMARISIAAKSSDLQLYVAAHLTRIKTKSRDLREEIVSTLTQEAKGMFQWVKCQIDYLARLPNDFERRKALKTLPPDLPATYIRILERIDAEYPEQTKQYVKRALKWLVLGVDLMHQKHKRDICHAVSIEADMEQVDPELVPSENELATWLSSLVKEGGESSKMLLELSHFTVKEFLLSPSEHVTSLIARQYLVSVEDMNYIAEAWITYLAIENEADRLRIGYFELVKMFAFYDSSRPEPRSFRKVFSHHPLSGLRTHIRIPGKLGHQDGEYSIIEIAAACLLPQTCARLLANEAKIGEDRQTSICEALHYAISSERQAFKEDPTISKANWAANEKRRCAVMKILLERGADPNWPVSYRMGETELYTHLSPLCSAIANYHPTSGRLLKDWGASVKPNESNLGIRYSKYIYLVRKLDWDFVESDDLLFEKMSAFLNDIEKDMIDTTNGVNLGNNCGDVAETLDLISTFPAMRRKPGKPVHPDRDTRLETRRKTSENIQSSNDVDALIRKTKSLIGTIDQVNIFQERMGKRCSPFELFDDLMDLFAILQDVSKSHASSEWIYFYREPHLQAHRYLGPLSTYALTVSATDLRVAFEDFASINHGYWKHFPHFPSTDEMQYIWNESGKHNQDVFISTVVEGHVELTRRLLVFLLQQHGLSDDHIRTLLARLCSRPFETESEDIDDEEAEDEETECEFEEEDFVLISILCQEVDPNFSVKSSHFSFHWTPLHMTIEHGRFEAALMLLAAGADPKIKDGRGYTALQVLVTVVGENDDPNALLDLAEELLRRGNDPLSVTSGGESALHHCASSAISASIALFDLLERETRARGRNLVDIVGTSPLHIACQHRIPRAVEIILRGPDAAALIEGYSEDCGSVIYAAVDGITNEGTRNLSILKYLIARGADVNTPCPSVFLGTPLALAVYHERDDICSLLLKHGANTNVRAGKFEDIEELARAIGANEIISLLRRAQGKRRLIASK